jgi:hypothetical protein
MSCQLPCISTHLPSAVGATLCKLHDGYTFVGRKIEDITSKYLHKAVSSGLQQIYWGLPLTCALSLLPLHAPTTLIAAAVTHLAIFILEINETLSKETLDTLYLGLRSFCIIEAIKAPILGYMLWPAFLVGAVDSAIRADQSHISLTEKK